MTARSAGAMARVSAVLMWARVVVAVAVRRWEPAWWCRRSCRSDPAGAAYRWEQGAAAAVGSGLAVRMAGWSTERGRWRHRHRRVIAVGEARVGIDARYSQSRETEEL